jgi:TM2 domain-containing membrane protein YozV
MNKIITVLFPIALLFAGVASVQSQKSDFGTTPSPATFNIGYYGNNLWNPGLNAGIEQPWSFTQNTNKKQRAYTIEKFFNADVGFFRDYSRQTPFFTHVGINRRRNRENKIHLQMGFSPVGIYRSFLPETWEYTVNGTVEKIFLPSRWYYAPVVSMGIGRFRNNQPGTGWFVEMNLTTLIPYNTYVMPLINVKAGYRIPLKKQIVKINIDGKT